MRPLVDNDQYPPRPTLSELPLHSRSRNRSPPVGDTLEIEHFDQRMDRVADITAANMLISHADYAAAETHYEAHPNAIARELGVTTHLFAVWRNTHERIRT